MTTSVPIVEINAAIAAHEQWKSRLLAVIESGRCDISSAFVRSDSECALGAWLYRHQRDPKAFDAGHFDNVRKIHADFHRAAGGVISYVERDNPSAARFLMEGEYVVISNMLIDALQKWKAALIEMTGPPGVLGFGRKPGPTQ